MSIYGNLILNEFDISASRITELSDFCNNQSIEESVQLLTESMDFSVFEKMGFNSRSISIIKSNIISTSSNIVKTIKQEGITNSSKTKILNYYNNFFNEISSALSSLNIDIVINIFGKEYNIDKVKDATIIFVFGFIANSLINSILSILLGSVGQIIVLTVVGPIVEEIGKQAAVRQGCTVEYTVLFNTFEFSMYVASYAPVVGLVRIIKTRLLTVGMHLTSTIVHFLTTNKEIQKKLGLDKNEDKEKLSLIGFITGNLIHITWNSLDTFTSIFEKIVGRF